MATYEEIYGKRVEVLDADPTLNSSYEGQVWYNSTAGALKSVVSASAWHATSRMITGRGQTGGTGSQTAALIVGGNSPITNKTEEYNGSGFSVGGNLPFSRMEMGVAGPQTAAVAFGGFTSPPPPGANATVEYDGSSWTSGNNMNQGRTNVGSAGTQTAALAFGGSEPNSPGQWTEEYDGTNWTAQNNLGTGRYQLMGNNVGTQTAALCVGGFISTAKDLVEEYDGTNWTATTALPTAGGNQMRVGLSTTALAAGGTPGPNDGTKCYSFDGSTWTATASLATPRSSTSGAGNNTSAVDAGAPSNSATSEEFNVSINTTTAAAWASGTSMNTPRKANTGGYGTTTAGLIAGGHSAPNAGIADSEEFDGSSWTEGPNMNTARGWISASGTQTAALGAGGYTGPPNTAGVTATEEYDGSNWTSTGSLSQSVYGGGGFGSQTAGVKAGGYNNTLPPGNVTTQTEEYNGSSWTTNPNGMGTGRYAMAGSGPATAGLVAGGYQYASPAGQTTKTEHFDGTNWTTGGALNLSRKGLASSGNSQTACLVFGGNSSNSVNPQTYSGYTEEYDGTAWATRPSMATGRDGVGGSKTGTTTAAFVAGGYLGPPGQTNAVEEFTGETETVVAKTLTTS